MGKRPSTRSSGFKTQQTDLWPATRFRLSPTSSSSTKSQTRSSIWRSKCKYLPQATSITHLNTIGLPVCLWMPAFTARLIYLIAWSSVSYSYSSSKKSDFTSLFSCVTSNRELSSRKRSCQPNQHLTITFKPSCRYTHQQVSEVLKKKK